MAKVRSEATRQRDRERRRRWRRQHPEESIASLLRWKAANPNYVSKRRQHQQEALPLFLYRGRDSDTLPLFDEEQIKSRKDGFKQRDGEQWRVVEGFVNYEASTHGRVRNRKTLRPIWGSDTNEGYNIVGLIRIGESKQTYWLRHRLVAMVFIPNPSGLPIVNHIDGNKCNNAVSNLEWVTAQHNARHWHRINPRRRGRNKDRTGQL